MSKKQGQGFGVYAAQSGKQLRLTMQELWLTGTVLPVGARLVVRHTFQSQEKKPLEAVYAFALPRDAAMRRFRIVGEGFNVESALKPTEEARQAYEEGLEGGHLSALAQQYGDGLVNLNVGNIRPMETVTVYIEIAAGVACTDTGFRFRFPFTLAPGYHPRAAYGATEEGEGEIMLPEEIFGDIILPPWRQDARELHRVGFDLNLALDSDTLEIASPSHSISVQQRPGGPARVSLATEADIPDRDLVLEAKYSLKAPAVFAGLDASGKARFAAVVPSTCFGPAPDAPKRVVFLIDHSGSMEGKPFEQAKRATLACIAALRPEDRFGIVFFENSITVFPAGCTAADQEQRDAARAFVNGMETAGGTELSAGICEAATLLPGGGDILLLTDGQVYETETIITRARKAGVRVHCLGIGSASQDRFLALLARKTGGASHFATPRERVDEAALRLFNAIGAPAAEEVSCEITGMKQADFAPDLPELVRVNEPLLIFGSCTGSDNGNLQLSWKGGNRTIPIPFPVKQDQQASPASDVSKEAETPVPLGETLKLVQGARITTDLESLDTDAPETQRAAERHRKRQEKRWIALAEEYGLANPAMSLVAVVERTDDRPGAVPVTRVVPVGMPQDTAFESYFGRSGNIVSRTRNALIMNNVCACAPPPDFSLAHRMFGRQESRKRISTDAVENRLLDRLFELTGHLEADGGLPGPDLETRIANTLAGLIVLRRYAHDTGEQHFDVHAQRMSAFLDAQDINALSPNLQKQVQRALTLLDAGKIPAENCMETYLQLGDNPGNTALWKWIEVAVK